MQITQLKTLNVERGLKQRPELGGGGVDNSYENAEGIVYVDKIQVDRDYGSELSYEVYDENGEVDAFNEPLLTFSGFTYVTNIEGEYFIIIDKTVEGVADIDTGSLNFTFVFSNAEEDIGLQKIVPINVSNNEPTLDELNESNTINTNATEPTTTIDSCGNVTNVTNILCSPINTNCSGISQCNIIPGAGNDTPSVTPTESTAVTEEEYLGVVEAIQTIENLEVTEESTATTEDEYFGTETTEESTATTEDEYFGIEVMGPTSDTTEVTEESTATTEEEYLGIEAEVLDYENEREQEIVTQVEDEGEVVLERQEEIVTQVEGEGEIIQQEIDTRQAWITVKTGEELKNALGAAKNINIITDLVINEFLYVPGDTVIRGINNPTLTVNAGAAFNIREDNITLVGFTLTSGPDTKPYGIEIGRKNNRNNPLAPKNIIIDSIIFDNIGGNNDRPGAAVNISGYQLVLSLIEPTKEVPGLIEGSELIKNITIQNNIFRNIPNNAIDIWNAENVTIQSNVFENTKGRISTMGNAIRGNSLVNSKISSNTLKDIGRTGIEITGNGSDNILVENNNIEQFGTQEILTNTFTSGISIVQGANNVTIKNNIIEGSGKGGGVEMAQNSSNFLIENNTVKNVNKGIAISAHSDTFNIKNNTIDYLQYGIQTYQVWNGRISNNIIRQPDEVVQARPAIAIEQSNNIVTASNTIIGNFYEINNEKAIFSYGNYPTNPANLLYAGPNNLTRVFMLNYSKGLDSIYNSIYKPAATVNNIEHNTFLFNILDGEDTLFKQQLSKVNLPQGTAGSTGNQDDVEDLEEPTIPIIKNTFDKTVGKTDDNNIDGVIKDNQTTANPEVDNSTAIINIEDTTVDITTIKGTEIIDKDILDIKDVVVDPETGFDESLDTDDQKKTKLPTTEDLSDLININTGTQACNNDVTCIVKCSTPCVSTCVNTIVSTVDTVTEITEESTATTEEEYLGIQVDIPSIDVTGPLIQESTATTEEEYFGISFDSCGNTIPKEITEESTATTEEEYLGIQVDTPSIDTTEITDLSNITDEDEYLGTISTCPTSTCPTGTCPTSINCCCIPGPGITGCCIPGSCCPACACPPDTSITGCPPGTSITGCCIPGSCCPACACTPCNQGGIVLPPGCKYNQVDPPVSPPVIIDPPEEVPPFIPAECGDPPVPRIGVDPGEDPDNQIFEEEEDEVVVEEILIYPAPVQALQSPFLSNTNFDTNFTKKEPAPFSFNVNSDTATEVENKPPSIDVKTKQTLCEEEEDCNKLGF